MKKKTVIRLMSALVKSYDDHELRKELRAILENDDD